MAQKAPEEGWTMQDGTPWPGNNVRNHPGMIQVMNIYVYLSILQILYKLFLQSNFPECKLFLQVLLGHIGPHDSEENELPRLVYVSREKRPGFEHHKKAGAMNALVKP